MLKADSDPLKIHRAYFIVRGLVLCLQLVKVLRDIPIPIGELVSDNLGVFDAGVL